jgi:hypothetical protein
MKSVEGRWSIHVWFWGFIFVFLSHAFAVFWLGERQTFSSHSPRPAPFLYMAGGPDTETYLAEHAILRDPTLFALPHVKGFSGGAWLHFVPQAPPLSNWTAAPEWLTQPISEPGRTLDQYVATNRLPEDDLLASLRTTPAAEIRIPDRPLLTSSIVKVTGPLAQRKIAFAPALPNIPTNDVMASTAVALSVNRHGIVESASIVHRESGPASSDHEALELARTFLFEPLPPAATPLAPPTFGHLVFTWNTVPPTNAAAPSPAMGAP